MGKRIQKAKNVNSQGHGSKSGHHSTTCRRPAGRKAGPAPDPSGFGKALKQVVSHCFPDLNGWLSQLPDPRLQVMCKYLGRHIWWQIILTFVLRNGSRNAFDADRNSGQMPDNVLRLCGQKWDEKRLGKRRTVTCSENAVRHAGRVPTHAVAAISLAMVKRLMQMRLLDGSRLFGRWWLIAIDGTLQDRGRKTKKNKPRYRYVVEAKLVGPWGSSWPLMTEFRDIRSLDREKEDCELNACLRLIARLRKEFPRLPICLLFDGLYPVQSVFDSVAAAGWKFIATLKEGRQRNGWDEAVQTMLLSPSNIYRCSREGEHGTVEQTLRWTQQVPFGKHQFDVLFAGEISPESATLWCWVTNFSINTAKTANAVANHGGRFRNCIESSFNVQKNGGFGLEHAFCANNTASQNYHLIMQVAHIICQLLVGGFLRRLTRGCRKITDQSLIKMLRKCLTFVAIEENQLPKCQIRLVPI